MGGSGKDSEINLNDIATVLFNQQIWCWGRDIESAEGNLLVKYGFQRIENDPRRRETSIYRLDLSPTSRVILRGFGVFCGNDQWGGLFLRRFSFAPKLTSESDLDQLPWSSSDLPNLESPNGDRISNCKNLLLMLTNWIRDYEDWIKSEFGICYRIQTLLPWEPEDQEKLTAEEMLPMWELLRRKLADAGDETIYNFGIAKSN